jgi:chromosome segregation ATPase
LSYTRGLASAMAVCVTLYLHAGPVVPDALAQGLDAAQIAQFQSKLEIARRARDDLSQNVTCLNQRDAQLVSLRDNLEERIGTLRREEKRLVPEANRLKTAYDGYMREYEKERRDLDGFRRHVQGLEARKRGQEQALRECKSKWYTINASCDLAYNILEVTGDIKNYDGEIAAAVRRERIAHESANFTLENLQRTERAFDLTKAQANALDAKIHRTEHEMGATKAALSDLREAASPYQALIDEFANAIEEAKRVDLEDARARTARKVASIAETLDAAMARSNAAIQHVGSVLPAGWMAACTKP